MATFQYHIEVSTSVGGVYSPPGQWASLSDPSREWTHSGNNCLKKHATIHGVCTADVEVYIYVVCHHDLIMLSARADSTVLIDIRKNFNSQH